MHIDKLDSRTNHQSVTVTLTYDECRDINNGLYHASKQEGRFKNIYGTMKFLFDMIKHGNIQPETVRTLNELSQEKEKSSEKET